MTDPKLRGARIAEAKRRAEANIRNVRYDEGLAHHLIDLIESDWRPEPEVDAVTLAYRGWALERAFTTSEVEWITSGSRDKHADAAAFRAGHAHALANCADVRRMDWLELKCVEVRTPLVHGSRELFRAVPDDSYEGEDGPSDLRTKIDRAMEGGE